MYFNVSMSISLEPSCGTGVQCPIKDHMENKEHNIKCKCIQKVILRKTMRTTINFYLVNLSAADLLSTLWCPLHRCFLYFIVLHPTCWHFSLNIPTYYTNTLNFTNFFLSQFAGWVDWGVSAAGDLLQDLRFLLHRLHCRFCEFFLYLCFCVFLVVQDSSIGDLVTH